MDRRSFRAAWPALVLAAAVLLPFLGKAYTIDDPLFLYQARHVLEDPLHPTAFDVVWSLEPHRMSALMASGPGMAYLLVPTLLAGGAEWVAHLTQLLLLALAIVATASLALTLDGDETQARRASLLLAATPAVLGMAATAMPDVAAMALGVLGLERTAAFGRDARRGQAVVAALYLGAATLCRSHLAALAVVAWLLGPNDRRRWIVPVAALLAAAAAFTITRDPQSHAGAGAVAGAAATFVFAPAVLRNVVSFPVHLALAFPFAIAWLLLCPIAIVRSPVLYVAGAGAWAYIRLHPEVGPQVAAIAAGLGAAALFDLAWQAFKRRDRIDGMLATWCLTPIAVVPYLHLPSKYLLAAAPAMAIAVARQKGRLPKLSLAVPVVCGTLLGVLILRADARFAGTGRRAAETLVAPAVTSGKTVWFNGHWGFQWYAERAGARPLTQTPPHPHWGDLVIASGHAEGELMGAMPNKRLVSSLDDTRPGGRIMSRACDAGFFSNGWGYLPWAWGSDSVDRYEVWSIEPGQ
ncbi:MAG TPA: hypothetical protein VFV19_11690 [Candidatus Polarisedimenticolaceae bacterium]|nr:hypothetical protein [Candidatus Polarisedimenticolaceae bacterium]